MAKLLKERPKAPDTRRVKFSAPAEIVDRMDVLVAHANKAGFDLDVDAALADAYAGLVKRLERELEDVGVDAASAETRAQPATPPATGATDATNLGTAA